MASIRERNGKFNVIYSYTDADGKRKQKWETYATKAEAKKRKKEIEYKEETCPKETDRRTGKIGETFFWR